MLFETYNHNNDNYGHSCPWGLDISHSALLVLPNIGFSQGFSQEIQLVAKALWCSNNHQGTTDSINDLGDVVQFEVMILFPDTKYVDYKIPSMKLIWVRH